MRLEIQNVKMRSTAIRRIYLEAFPKRERMPFPMMVAMSKLWNTQFFGFYHNSIPCGFTYSEPVFTADKHLMGSDSLSSKQRPGSAPGRFRFFPYPRPNLSNFRERGINFLMASSKSSSGSKTTKVLPVLPLRTIMYQESRWSPNWVA